MNARLEGVPLNAAHVRGLGVEMARKSKASRKQGTKKLTRVERIDRVFDKLCDLRSGCSSSAELNSIETAVASLRWLVLASGEYSEFTAQDFADLDKRLKQARAALDGTVVGKDSRRRAALVAVAHTLSAEPQELDRHLNVDVEIEVSGRVIDITPSRLITALESAVGAQLDPLGRIAPRAWEAAKRVCALWHARSGKWVALNELLDCYGLAVKAPPGKRVSGTHHPLQDEMKRATKNLSGA